MNCREGDLAYISHTAVRENIGAFVMCEELIPIGTKIELLRGYHYVVDKPLWRVNRFLK